VEIEAVKEEEEEAEAALEEVKEVVKEVEEVEEAVKEVEEAEEPGLQELDQQVSEPFYLSLLDAVFEIPDLEHLIRLPHYAKN